VTYLVYSSTVPVYLPNAIFDLTLKTFMLISLLFSILTTNLLKFLSFLLSSRRASLSNYFRNLELEWVEERCRW